MLKLTHIAILLVATIFVICQVATSEKYDAVMTHANVDGKKIGYPKEHPKLCKYDKECIRKRIGKVCVKKAGKHFGICSFRRV
ncbi:hypothetical protein LIER_41692 [Lithospermum erythrorhizon]|uniref:Uncharacterized protein n=1 Tax=Lithospermum erythrorhizon TaxID=34254 RepID=A0AAV3RGF5_LITER